MYVVLVLSLASSHSARADSEATVTSNEDNNAEDILDTDTDNQSRNFFLGTFIKIGGDLLGIAGNLGYNICIN